MLQLIDTGSLNLGFLSYVLQSVRFHGFFYMTGIHCIKYGRAFLSIETYIYDILISVSVPHCVPVVCGATWHTPDTTHLKFSNSVSKNSSVDELEVGLITWSTLLLTFLHFFFFLLLYQIRMISYFPHECPVCNLLVSYREFPFFVWTVCCVSESDANFDVNSRTKTCQLSTLIVHAK